MSARIYVYNRIIRYIDNDRKLYVIYYSNDIPVKFKKYLRYGSKQLFINIGWRDNLIRWIRIDR